MCSTICLMSNADINLKICILLPRIFIDVYRLSSFSLIPFAALINPPFLNVIGTWRYKMLHVTLNKYNNIHVI